MCTDTVLREGTFGTWFFKTFVCLINKTNDVNDRIDNDHDLGANPVSHHLPSSKYVSATSDRLLNFCSETLDEVICASGLIIYVTCQVITPLSIFLSSIFSSSGFGFVQIVSLSKQDCMHVCICVRQ